MSNEDDVVTVPLGALLSLGEEAGLSQDLLADWVACDRFEFDNIVRRWKERGNG